jgi:uncharacterized SAM-binding protein YcdF (DUF218 family)
MKRFFFASAIGLLMAITFWLLGAIWFLSLMPSSKQLQVAYPTDAIVVLTGGHGRAEKGIELLQNQRAKWLFVSGVHPDADKSAIFQSFHKQHPAEYNRIQSRIILGKKALDTRGNALETAEWAKSRHVTSIRLVTAHYHIPRSLLEFERRMPRTTIVPSPVFVDDFATGQWWHNKSSLLLILTEYHKYMASLIFGILTPQPRQ